MKLFTKLLKTILFTYGIIIAMFLGLLVMVNALIWALT